MDLLLFDPQGPTAAAERNVIVLMVFFMLIIVVPMFIFLFWVVRTYRAKDTQRTEPLPDRPHRVGAELVLWAIPAVVVVALGILTWRSAHALDPYQPVTTNHVQPITIQVIALPWKWLFIYPAQDIATMNFVEFPVGTPIHFYLTADGSLGDAPMSSFWIPQLGSQMYAMAAMQTQLNLMASTTGDFLGKDTEINGAGYAGMTFKAHVVSMDEFVAWASGLHAFSDTSSPVLNAHVYEGLSKPSTYDSPAMYASVQPGLFDSIVTKYMTPSNDSHSMPRMPLM